LAGDWRQAWSQPHYRRCCSRGSSDVRLDAITPRHVHAVKKALDGRKPKTVSNVLVVLKAMSRVAVDLGTLKSAPCRISLLTVPKKEMAFYRRN
jgi:hypothetical protein